MLECVGLVIGVEKYQELPRVEGAGTEARVAMFGGLSRLVERTGTNSVILLQHDQPEPCGQPNAVDSPDHATIVGKADCQSLRRAVSRFQGLLQQRSGQCWAFLSYSGHAFLAEDGRHYLLGNDALPETVHGICFERELLLPMRQLAVASLAVLNCCRNIVGQQQPWPRGGPRPSEFGCGDQRTADVAGAGFGGATGTTPPPPADVRSAHHDQQLQQQQPAGQFAAGGGSQQLGLGGAYVCWATGMFHSARINTKYTFRLAKYLFDPEMSVLEADAKAAGELEYEQREYGQLPRGERIGGGGFIALALQNPLAKWKDLDVHQQADSGLGVRVVTAPAAKSLLADNKYAVYELYNPPVADAAGRSPAAATLDIVFFHGLRLGSETAEDLWWTSWSSPQVTVVSSGAPSTPTCCWPAKWLPEKLPTARVLSVSYPTSVTGGWDATGEKVLSLLTSDSVDVGKGGRRPVVLVGHSLGGLIVKEVVLQALHGGRAGDGTADDCSTENAAWQRFGRSIVGVVFYATPHSGSVPVSLALLPAAGESMAAGGTDLILQSTLLDKVNAYIQELNRKFQLVRKEQGRMKVLCFSEMLSTQLPGMGDLLGIIVSEAASTMDGARNVRVNTDHVNINKPASDRHVAFQELVNFIKQGHNPISP